MSDTESSTSLATAGRIVVVGGGQAGAEAAAALRQEGHTGSITILSDESVLPYSRPPLSKGYLLGSESEEELFIRSETSYREHSIDIHTDIRVVDIDTDDKTVGLSNGDRLGYDSLVLATGGTPRTLPDEALRSASNVLSLRVLKDADILRSKLQPGVRLVLIGGGYIGLEIAAVARNQGAIVTVLEAQPRVLARVASPEMSGLLTRVHTEEGVDIRTGIRIAEYITTPTGDVAEIILEDGSRLPADVVLVGIGVTPNIDLAAQIGLTVDNGIVVDEFLRTSDPNIFAIGDVARFPDENGELRRVESMPNAVSQGAAVAASILGRSIPYRNVPWFWSDQFDLKLQMVGIAGEYDQTVVRGDLASGRTAAIFYLENKVVKAVDVVSDPKAFALARRLVTAKAVIENPAELADITVPLRNLVPGREAPVWTAS